MTELEDDHPLGDEVVVLDLATGTGIWEVASTAGTSCRLDLDTGTLTRPAGGPERPRSITQPLVTTVALVPGPHRTLLLGEGDVVRVGRRHIYLTEADRRSPTYAQWVQLAVASIRRVG